LEIFPRNNFHEKNLRTFFFFFKGDKAVAPSKFHREKGLSFSSDFPEKKRTKLIKGEKNLEYSKNLGHKCKW
jgi:hypothetical protein